VRPLVQHAADLAKHLGYRPDVGILEDHKDSLLADEPPTGPGLLLVDAWATTAPGSRESLRRLDGLDKPWISVMLPWNRKDDETVDAEHKLRESLDISLHRKLAEGRLTSRIAVNGIPSLEEFGRALPAMVSAAATQYFRRARAYPPTGPLVQRPRLSGPEAPADPPDPPDTENHDE
jgi:FxsC-like protein